MNILRNLSIPELSVAPQHDIELQTANPLHFSKDGKLEKSTGTQSVPSGSFGDLVLKALNQTNSQILDSQLLQQQAIVSPDSVDPSTLVISMLKANMNLNLTKAVIDRATAAYRELTTVR